MSPLGIYFGSKFISIVESKGKKVAKSVQIPMVLNRENEPESVPEEIRIVALIKDELRKNGIQSNEAVICLSGKDLIVRNFEMPSLPKDELASAVNFEAKKYIPFKLEEMVSAFQARADRAKKSQILFVGIKKTTIDKYSSIMSQLGVNVSSIEYSAFSILRLFKVTGIKDSGVIGMVSADTEEESEVNFTVLENGFPLFSRDINLVSEPSVGAQSQGGIDPMSLEKLKSELRISLDFYNRKFPSRPVSKVFMYSSENIRIELESAIKDMGVSVAPLDVSKVLDRSIVSVFGLVRAYSCSLLKTVKVALSINLLAARKAKTPMPALGGMDLAKFDAASLLSGLKIDPKFIVMAVVICIGAYMFGLSQNIPVKNEIETIKRAKVSVPGVSGTASYDELVQTETKYKQKITPIVNIIAKRPYATPILDAIAKVIPNGVWLTDLNFSGSEKSSDLILTLNGMAYEQDRDKQMQLVNDFILGLRRDPVLTKYFSKEITITSVDSTRATDGTETTRFNIVCRGSGLRPEGSAKGARMPSSLSGGME